MRRLTNTFKVATLAFAAASFVATSAMATDGMFGNGTGARNKALAGAGVADQNDATAIATNPAGLVHSDNQFSFSASLFSPLREYTLYTPPPPAGAGTIRSDSGSKFFVIPNMAWSHRVDGNTTFGLSMYGNGGMNTDYPVNPFGGPGRIGIDLTQAFFSAALAKQFGNVSVGVAPIVGVQLFSAEGVGGPETSAMSVGIGARAGVEVALRDNFRVGLSGSTPVYMTALTDYNRSVFAISNGVLDVPGTIQAGVALDVMPNVTLMADYKRIFYSGVEAIGRSTNFLFAGTPAFGWSDINIYKVGAEWDVNPGLTLRAGYSYNDSPLSKQASAFFANMLAPATVQHHITGGAKLKVSDSLDFELAGMYAPEESVRTPGNAFFGLPASKVEMYQYELTAGIIWHFSKPEASYK